MKALLTPSVRVLVVWLVLYQWASAAFQATGFKVGEVTDSSAIVWTRITMREEGNGPDGIMPTFIDKAGESYVFNGRDKPEKDVDPVEIRYPEDKSFEDMRYATPGTPGETRISYRLNGTDSWTVLEWAPVVPAADFTRQETLQGLESNSTYQIRVETRDPDGSLGELRTGRFMTAPAVSESAKVIFTVSTGQAYHDQDTPRGFKIYPMMLETIHPSFFVHTGDIVYYDRMAKDVKLAQWHWQRTYSLPTNVEFHTQVSSYFIKDDHDAWTNDSYPTMKGKMGSFSWEDGLRVFREQVPMGEKTYRNVRWGKDLEIWLVEGRDFRSPNPMPDGPEKTIWGAEQKQWFKDTVQASDATFRVLISPTPIVGPDRNNKNDNHANEGFATEGQELRDFIAAQKNMVVVCGDRHWQYHSIDPKTGLREYCCGPASDPHAGGWKQSDFRDDYHRFLRVKGGVLAVTSERVDGKPTLTFRFHDVKGDVHFEDVLTAE